MPLQTLRIKTEEIFIPFMILLFLGTLGMSWWYESYLFLGIPFAVLFALLSIQDIRFAHYSLIASVPFSFLLEINFDFPDEFLMLFITLQCMFLIIINHRTLRGLPYWKNPILHILFISFLWMIISCLYSSDAVLSIKFVLKKCWYLTPFLLLPLLLFRDRIAMIRTVQCILISLFAVTCIIMVKQAQVGFRFDMIYDPLQPFFMNHVMYGSMVSAAVPLAIGALLLSRKLSVQWFMALAMLVLFGAATYFSYSRAAWMSLVFAGVVYGMLKLRLLPAMMLTFYGLLLTGVLWLAKDNRFLSFKPEYDKTVMHETLAEHIMATLKGTDISSAERYYRWIAAIRMSKDHPLVGVGPNNFYDHYKPYTIKSFRTWVSRNPERSTTHNYFIFLMVEQGYPAMILYGLLYLVLFYQAQKLYHKEKNRTDRLILVTAVSVLSVIFVNNFFSELLETDKIGSLFFLSIATLIVYSCKDYQTTSSDKSLPPTSS